MEFAYTKVYRSVTKISFHSALSFHTTSKNETRIHNLQKKLWLKMHFILKDVNDLYLYKDNMYLSYKVIL